MFRRRQPPEDEQPLDEVIRDDLDVSADAAGAGAPTGAGGRPRPQGPWDSGDVPDDGVPRVDLGALHVPVTQGLEMRVDMQDQVVVATTLVDGRSTLQVHAFAAPRSAGIWTEVREEIAESLRGSGGAADYAEGPFGPELHARIPMDVPAQGRSLQNARFLGVDGPRWFLRGLVTGPAATDSVQARRLEEAFRGIVVHRGGDAMAPRDMLPLRLPKEAMAGEPPAEPQRRHTLEMLERGPEITETR